jgi:putative ABC transport system permease protein
MGFYLRLAWRNIWRNRKRSLISIASILFAMVIALAMRSLQLGFYRHAINNVVSFYTGYLQVQAPEFNDTQSIDQSFLVVDSLTSIIHSTPYVTHAAPRLESFALASCGEITDGVLVVGIDPQVEDSVTGLARRVVEGRYLNAEDKGVLLGQSLAKHLNVGVGDTVILLGQGYHAVTAAGKYGIEGIIKFPNPDLDARMVYLRLGVAQYLFGADNRLTSVAVMIDKDQHMPAVVGNLQERLGGDYAVLSWREMMPELDQYIRSDNASGLIMLAILYLVIGFGILGTILMMTLERTREFGVLLAIGMGRGVLRRLVIIESVLLALVGAIAGVVLGIPPIIYLHFHPIPLTGQWAEIYRGYGFDPVMPFARDPGIFFWQGIIVLVIALVASLYPVFRVSRLKAVNAIRTG